MLRSAAERLSRRSRFRKRLPAEFGNRPIMVSAANQLAVYKPGRAGFDAMLLDWATTIVKPGMSVWDVGANMGFFTFPAAARGARVVAFEPDPFNQELLHSSRALNPDLEVRVIPAAVAATAGIATFNVAQRGRSANGLAQVEQSTQTGGIRQTYEVFTVALDSMLDSADAPDLIKVDAEGAEIEILRGAPHLLESVRPSWIIEVQGSNAAEIWSILSAADYQCFDAELPGHPARPDLSTVYNALLVPSEKS